MLRTRSASERNVITKRKMSRIPWFLPFLGLCIYVGIGMLMSYVTHGSYTKDFYIGSVLLFYAPVVLLAYHAAKIKQGKRRCIMIGSILALGFVYNVTVAAGISGNTSIFLIFYMYPCFWTYIISATIYFYILNWAASRVKNDQER